jgi:hypothetical protein
MGCKNQDQWVFHKMGLHQKPKWIYLPRYCSAILTHNNPSSDILLDITNYNILSNVSMSNRTDKGAYVFPWGRLLSVDLMPSLMHG